MTVLFEVSNVNYLQIKGGNTSIIVLLVNPKGRFFISLFLIVVQMLVNYLIGDASDDVKFRRTNERV